MNSILNLFKSALLQDKKSVKSYYAVKSRDPTFSSF